MRIQVQTTGVTYTLAKVPEPITDRETGQARVNAEGKPLYQAQLVALSADGAEVLQVKTSSVGSGLAAGGQVRCVNLIATPWSIGDRSGVSFLADAIEAVTQR